MANDSTTNPLPTWLNVVRKQVETVKFGTIQLTVHEGQVVQVERVERVRFDPRSRSQPTSRPIEYSPTKITEAENTNSGE